MKLHPILIAALAVLSPAFAEDTKTSAESRVTVKSDGNGSGKARVTIELNGKKEVREIELGNATEIKVEADSSDVKKAQHTTFLGVAPDELPEEVAAQLPLGKGEGVIVRSVIPDSPAAVAGLQKNDVLVRLDDQVLINAKQLKQLVSAKKAGDTVRLAYFRAGQKGEVEAKLSEQPETLVGSLTLDKKAEGLEYLRSLAGIGQLFDVSKRAVIVDSDGKVLTTNPDEKRARLDLFYKEALSPEQMKKFDTQLEAVQQQIKVAQERATEAIEQASKAVQKAAEEARAQIEKARQENEAAEKKARGN